MPSKKPQFVIRTEQEIIDKIGYIAKENERSTTQEIVYLIKQRIKEYEKQNGNITIGDITINGDIKNNVNSNISIGNNNK